MTKLWSLNSDICRFCVVATYRPCSSGCTDPFKEALDYLDNVISQLSFDSNVIVLGDLNADLGACRGSLATNTPNEQGKILLRYLHKWNYVSVHLHKCNVTPPFTYTVLLKIRPF